MELLFAMCIGVLKMLHDAGKSKIWFMLAMGIAIAAISGINYYIILLYLAPVLFYSMGSGQYHKAKSDNTFNDFQEIKYLDDFVAFITKSILGNQAPISKYRTLWGSIYCVICSLVFMLPFIFTNIWYSLPLLLWVFAVRNFHWWLAPATLFFSYSLLFFLSL